MQFKTFISIAKIKCISFSFCLLITLLYNIFKIIILKRSINIDLNHYYRYSDIDYYIKKCFIIKKTIFIKINVKKVFANTKKNLSTTLTKNTKKSSKKSKKTKNLTNFCWKTNNSKSKRHYKINIRIQRFFQYRYNNNCRIRRYPFKILHFDSNFVSKTINDFIRFCRYKNGFLFHFKSNCNVLRTREEGAGKRAARLGRGTSATVGASRELM